MLLCFCKLPTADVDCMVFIMCIHVRSFCMCVHTYDFHRGCTEFGSGEAWHVTVTHPWGGHAQSCLTWILRASVLALSHQLSMYRSRTVYVHCSCNCGINWSPEHKTLRYLAYFFLFLRSLIQLRKITCMNISLWSKREWDLVQSLDKWGWQCLVESLSLTRDITTETQIAYLVLCLLVWVTLLLNTIINSVEQRCYSVLAGKG